MNAKDIHARLRKSIPDPTCELDFSNAWQLLVATILSAQSTDKTVNRVTPVLFERWAGPEQLSDAPIEEIETVVKTTGFFRRKASAIQQTARQICEEFDGKVPASLESLITLRGVARKTANLVLGVAMGIASGIVVDTHVGRVARRLRLSKQKDPAKVEKDLCKLWPKSEWIEISHRLVLHGRYTCTSKNPKCDECVLNDGCPSRVVGES